MSNHLFTEPHFSNSGDKVLLVALGDGIDLEVNRNVHALTARLRRQSIPGVEALVPAYNTLAVAYDPLAIAPEELQQRIREESAGHTQTVLEAPRIVDIPVCYGGEYGPDLAFVAAHTGLTTDDVIAIHSARPYHIYTIGFAPGFCYLGGLDVRLHSPRLETPRTLVPAGSVGIAEAQTGVYPLPSPGGWRLIGRTPLTLFDAGRPDPFLYQAGDSIRFVAISQTDYAQLAPGGAT